jgi:hypothetical protein
MQYIEKHEIPFPLMLLIIVVFRNQSFSIRIKREFIDKKRQKKENVFCFNKYMFVLDAWNNQMVYLY